MQRVFGKMSTAVWMALLGVIFLVAGYLYLRSVGQEYEWIETVRGKGEISAVIEDDSDDVIEIAETRREGDRFTVRVRSKQESGKAYLRLDENGNYYSVLVLYVHKSGVITRDEYFGDCKGILAVRIGVCIYLAILLGILIAKLRSSMRRSLYQYRNILYFGLIIFMTAVLLIQALSVNSNNGIIGILSIMMSTAENFAILTFPLIAITAILVTVSNIQLIRKEGRTWRNMLACILGIFLGILALLPSVSYRYLSEIKWLDAHRWTSVGRFVTECIEHTCGSMAAYLECVLIGTIIVSVLAAVRIPKFDKDYILIHGSQIRKDGTLTKLLQSRADRAVEFAQMQKAATGKDIVFIPSGGKGSDEVMSEGDAIAGYLASLGIPQEQILVENRSSDTAENVVFSANMIREREGGSDAKIALATTNYHVFRACLIGASKGLDIEGIGSRTKRYFWINAFVREFIATIVSERRRHLFVVGMLIVINIVMSAMAYFSTAVLS